MTQEIFIVDPFNAPFVQGETKQPPDHLIGVVAVILLIFTLPMLGLNVIVVDAWLRNTLAVGASLVVVTLVTLSVDLILVGSAWWFWRRFRLRQAGELLPGTIQQASGEVRPGPQGNDFIITVSYQFTSPHSGETVTGVIAQTRNDQVDAPLPASGTPVRVLYRSDRNYRVM
jgi:hypothetical protein